MEDFEEPTPDEIAFHARINALLRRATKMSFDEVVPQYREIEAEFIERQRDKEDHVVETKRRITEWLLMQADWKKQPHEVCRPLWDELLQRGFSNINLRHLMSGIYVRCCQRNGAFDAGIEVLDQRIAELEKLLADPALEPVSRPACEEHIEKDKRIRDELKAGLRW